MVRVRFTISEDDRQATMTYEGEYPGNGRVVYAGDPEIIRVLSYYFPPEADMHAVEVIWSELPAIERMTGLKWAERMKYLDGDPNTFFPTLCEAIGRVTYPLEH
jgi:hypothetical protein